MDLTGLIIPFGASILIGALIGLERERKKQQAQNLSAVGIRTSILIALFGSLSGYLGQIYNHAIFFATLASLIILVISTHISLIIKHDRIGITTEITTILLFLFGAMCTYGMAQLAVILAIITTLVLSLRDYLHTTIANISDTELYDTLKFAIIAFIILPFLPDQNFDTQVFGTIMPELVSDTGITSVDVLNPYKIWLLIVFVSGISFLGYILVKVLGKKVGIGITGLLGGFYSSTATSLTLADKSKKTTSKNFNPFIAGITLAIATSFIKMFIFIRTLNEELFMRVLIPMGLMFVFLLFIGLLIIFKKSSSNKEANKKATSERTLETPFKLKKAVKLGAFIVSALIVAKISLAYAGIELYYIVAILCSLLAIDDPIIVSTSAIAGTLLDTDNAKNIILVVIFLNAVQKAGIVWIFGNRKMVRPLLYIFTGLLLVTTAGFIYL